MNWKIYLSVSDLKKSYYQRQRDSFQSRRAMKHWKVLLVTTVGREEIAKTFWPWWQPFNSLFFGTFTLFLCFPFSFLLLKKVCVFVCVCLCMYVCMCVCLFVCMGRGGIHPHAPPLSVMPALIMSSIKIRPVQEKIEIVLIFSFLKFWFLIYIQKTLKYLKYRSDPF